MIGISHELLDSLRLINTPQKSLRFSEMQGQKEITTSWHTVKATLRVEQIVWCNSRILIN